MVGKLLMVLSVLAVDLSPCFGQYGGGEMMGGAIGEMMAGGGMAGLGAMMGGGGMAGLGGMMGGGGSMGGMGTGIGAMVRQRAMANAVNMVTEAVHFIVGPQASPDQPLLDYVKTQTSPPRNMMQMMGYLPHMQRIARKLYGPWLAASASSTKATANQGTGNATNAAPAGKSLVQLQADLDTIVMQRAIEYMNRPQTQQAAAGAGAGAMGAISAMIPMMVQGITAQYM
ncbi:uncharacterized protein LOC123553208 [Mercenaria mercenaria]|uniref:uncharacterized protein LOC123553208 n=1 Tax=Mercenaria mercenaria TaxID=6596 RepID=UPI00234F46B5|nr:uncharacterized protein LOC123553208 [Mercenaria mercenaria]